MTEKNLRYFFCENFLLDDKQIVVSAEEKHHMVSVDRLREGDDCYVINGKGVRAFCRLMQVTKQSITLKVMEGIYFEKNKQPFLWVLPSVCRRGNFNFIVEKAVELGTQRLTPLLTERTVVKIEAPQKFQEKLVIVGRQALKQSHQYWETEIDLPVNLAPDSKFFSADYLFLLDPFDGTPVNVVLAELRSQNQLEKKTIVLVIGPEGGFSQEEKKIFLQKKFRKVQLPGGVLRAETAVLAALSLFRFSL